MTKIAFFGHFTGPGSYVVVCSQILRFLEQHGAAVRPYNLRDTDGWEPLEGADYALLFGSPLHWDVECPSSPGQSMVDVMVGPDALRIGYHVCDVDTVPQSWVEAMNRLDRVLSPSMWCNNTFARCGVSVPSSVVFHGFDPEVFKPDIDAEPTGDLLHFCSAADPARKGTAELIDAMCGLPQNELTIISSPEAYRKISRWAQASPARDRIEVRFVVGATPQEQAELYRSHNYVVVPSRAEGFGMIPLEASACGTPVAMTSRTGHDETFDRIIGPKIDLDDAELTVCGQNGQGGKAPELLVSDIIEALWVGHEVIDPIAQHRRLAQEFAWDVVLQPLLDVIEVRS